MNTLVTYIVIEPGLFCLLCIFSSYAIDKNAVVDAGRTLLHTACFHDNLDAVLYLCAMEVDTDVTDHHGK